ncbi:Six-hairpin glycosidase [Dipodascopsis tothii]|uniref:Six-hairpin glycosidase n=1 Tax=Dipodascopsis tothii TaxID=44089 RepID=UPI0034CD2F2E
MTAINGNTLKKSAPRRKVSVALDPVLEELFSESVVAKIWGVAHPATLAPSPPTTVPDYTAVGGTDYVFAEFDWWTSGFFPGSLFALVERAIKYPEVFPSDKLNLVKLQFGATWWAQPVHGQAPRTDTHDISFMVQPSMQRAHELLGDKAAYNSMIVAARALASRYDPKVGAIRSWDQAINYRYSFTDPAKDFLVIIDNMCNLRLLYWAALQTGDLELATIATKHAETTLAHHIRYPDWSAHHLLVYDAETGDVKHKLQNQGLSDDSTWSRGQAWAIMGYAETYEWTKDPKFLDAAINLGKYFMSRLPEDGVPHWDFDAPRPTYRDTSAAMAAANGFLIIYQATSDETYLADALYLLSSAIKLSLSPRASFLTDKDGNTTDVVDLGGFDTILKNATINNNPDAHRKLADTGLVYADYYFILAGNKLLELGVF